MPDIIIHVSLLYMCMQINALLFTLKGDQKIIRIK